MRIALLADSWKNELAITFSIAFESILAQHELVSFFTTATLIENETELKFIKLSGEKESSLGQVAAQVSYNEIDAVIYLRDAQLEDTLHHSQFFRVCDKNNIPYASNIATAEILIMAIGRGDLEWRELVR